MYSALLLTCPCEQAESQYFTQERIRSLSMKVEAKVSNMTCIMRELEWVRHDIFGSGWNNTFVSVVKDALATSSEGSPAQNLAIEA